MPGFGELVYNCIKAQNEHEEPTSKASTEGFHGQINTPHLHDAA